VAGLCGAIHMTSGHRNVSIAQTPPRELLESRTPSSHARQLKSLHTSEHAVFHGTTALCRVNRGHRTSGHRCNCRITGYNAARQIQTQDPISASKPSTRPSIFGNIFQIPREDPYLHMEKLSQRYGDMFTLRIGDSYWLFLNSQRVVSDLLEKRAAIYSSRMNLPMASDLVSGGKRTLILPYGDLWRRERKVMHQILNNKQISTFEPYQDMESRALLYGYLRKPDDWWKAHTAFSSSVIMSVAFGRRAGLDDPNVRAAMGVAAEFVVFLAPGAALVDIFPFLVKIPWFKSLQPWRWYGDDLYRRTTE